MMPIKSMSGFTLLETLIATLLLALTVFAVVQSRSSALYNSAESENIAIAVQLLQKKTSELEFYFQRKLNADGVSGASEKLEGSFEEPYQDYKFRAEFRETLLEIKKDDIVGMMTDLGMDSSEAEVQIDQQSLAIGNINSAIKNNFGELEVWVEWNRFGRQKNINVLTHLIPTVPKITISLNPSTE
jgi:Tfp pilus assembly protein PilE